ncbi:hypothetical protein ACFU7D_04875, partial [Nocardioides sp. NPDC057577]
METRRSRPSPTGWSAAVL